MEINNTTDDGDNNYPSNSTHQCVDVTPIQSTICTDLRPGNCNAVGILLLIFILN